MIDLSIFRRGLMAATLIAMPSFLWAEATTTVQKERVAQKVLDSLKIGKGHLESSNLTQAESVIGFSGDLMSRVFNSGYGTVPLGMSGDKNRTEMDADFNVRMEVKPSPFLALWTRITFGYDFSGFYQNTSADISDFERTHINRDKVRDGVTVFEDMTAGTNFRTRNFSGRLLAGSAVWVDASPFTIWKRDPRPLWGWNYEGYEPELSGAAYYSQKSFSRRNDLGRLTWPKKPFGGMLFETFKMPMDLGLKIFVAEPSVMANTKPSSGSLSQLGDAEAINSPTNSGDLVEVSIYKEKAFSDVKAGLNLLFTNLDENLVMQDLPTPFDPQAFRYQFIQNDSTFLFHGNRDPFFVDTRIAGTDFTGNITPKLYIQSEFALSMDDTTYFRTVRQKDSLGNDLVVFDSRSGDSAWRIEPYSGNTPIEHKMGKVVPAFYAKLSSKIGSPMEAELVYIPKQFNSPYGITNFAVPMRQDMIQLGVGNSFYHNNITGINYKWMPKVPWGFFQLGLAEHIQVEAGRDVIRFNHRLNGREVWRASSSWARTEPTRILSNGLPYLSPKWEARLGDEGPNRNTLYAETQEGGYYGDDLMLWEQFVAYNSVAEANAGLVPEHRKLASSLNMDLGYNAQGLFHHDRKVMLTLYGNLSSLATTESIADPLIWTAFLRSEPVISVKKNFHIIALAGIETWKSDKAYMDKNRNLGTYGGSASCTDPATGTVVSCDNLTVEETIVVNREIAGGGPVVDAEKVPIDYFQWTLGLGFDWDFAPRAGLHVRYKYAAHQDKNYSKNDWDGQFLFAETKVWF